MVLEVSGVASHSAAKLDRSLSANERRDRRSSSDLRSPTGPKVIKFIVKPSASQWPRVIISCSLANLRALFCEADRIAFGRWITLLTEEKRRRKERSMAIVAKKVGSDGSVEDIYLADDPSDQSLIDTLGGQGDLVTVGYVGRWEILTTSKSDDHLIVGNTPHISDWPKKRDTCTLDDTLLKARANKGIRALKFLLGGG